MSRLKAFLIVLLLVGGGGSGALFGLNMLYQARIDTQVQSRLDGAADQFVRHLRVEAFETIQRLSRVAGDGKLTEALDQIQLETPSSTAESEEARRTRLKPANDALVPVLERLQKKAKTKSLVVLTSGGRVAARVPAKEKYADSLKGLPVFTECLGGIHRDALYELDKQVTRLGAVPLKDTRGKVAGCLLGIDPIDAQRVKAFSGGPGLEAAIFVNKAVAVGSLEASSLAPLSDKLDSNIIVWFGELAEPAPMFADWTGKGSAARIAAIPSGTDGMHAAVVLPLTPLVAPLKEAQKNLFMGVGALFIVGVLLALLLAGKKVDKEALKLRDAVGMIADGTSSSLSVDNYRGVYHDLATSVTRLMSGGGRNNSSAFHQESVSDLLGGPAEPVEADAGAGGSLDFESLLGGETAGASDAPAEMAPLEPPPSIPAVPPAPGFDEVDQAPAAPAAATDMDAFDQGIMQSEPSLPAGPPDLLDDLPPPVAAPPPLAEDPLDFAAAPAPLPASAPQPTAEPAPAASGGPRVELPGELAGIFDEAEETREIEPLIPPQARLEEAPPVAFTPSPPFAEPTPAPPTLDPVGDEQITSSDYRPDATVIAQVPDELLRAASSAGPEGTESIAAAPPTALPKPPVVPPPPEPAAKAPAGEDSHFKEVYEQFVATKKQCGESTSGLTFDRFAVKLRKNTADLKSRYRCRSVKFQVYVKNGKAALKATPIK